MQVDENVTRHLDKVLERNDWDLLILHYLGLDHIGHLAGPNSHLIGPKLSEMDNIIQKIHTGLVFKVCKVLFKLALNLKLQESKSTKKVCVSCIELWSDLI